MAHDPTVLAASIAAIPATIAGIAAWRAAGHTKKNTTTTNGRSAGEMIEDTNRVVHQLAVDLITHRSDPLAHQEDEEE